MFDLGSDKKGDLEENMEEIKNLIQNGNESSDQQGSEPDTGLGNMDNDLGDDSQESGKSFEERVKENHQKEMQQQNQSSGNSSDVNVPSTDPGQGTPQGGNGRQPSQDQIVNQDQDSSQKAGNNQLDRRNQEESESSQSERPSSPQDTLFLREEEFRSIRERIEEMNYLTQEMEQSMEKMKKTVRRERETSKNSSELVEAFSQRRSDVESTIESGQK